MTRKSRTSRKKINKSISARIKDAWAPHWDTMSCFPVLHWTIRTSNNKRKVKIEVILTPDKH